MLRRLEDAIGTELRESSDVGPVFAWRSCGSRARSRAVTRACFPSVWPSASTWALAGRLMARYRRVWKAMRSKLLPATSNSLRAPCLPRSSFVRSPSWTAAGQISSMLLSVQSIPSCLLRRRRTSARRRISQRGIFHSIPVFEACCEVSQYLDSLREVEIRKYSPFPIKASARKYSNSPCSTEAACSLHEAAVKRSAAIPAV